MTTKHTNMLRRVYWREKNLTRSAIAILPLAVLLTGCSHEPYDIDSPLGWEISFSFPHGAPPLNRNAETLCTLHTEKFISKGNLKVRVVLPDGLQLVSGHLEWQGDFDGNFETEIQIIKAKVRSAKVGNYEIRVCRYLPEWSPTLKDIMS